LITDREIAELVERFGLGPQGKAGVLLVDDEALNLRVLRGFLDDRWRVYEAASGRAALEIALEVPLDVVVTDQRMPGMTGVELLEDLRRRRPDVAGIVLTGFADMQALESAINRANVFRFLRKPWEPAEIVQAVELASAHVIQRRTIAQLVKLLADRSEELRGTLDQVKAQQEMLLHLERLGTIGRLSSGIIHDLKNVMVSLRMAEWEIGKTTTSGPLREIVTLGLGALDNMLRTLQSLLEYSRTGSLSLELRDVDPGAVVGDAIAISRMDPEFKMRRVHESIAAPLPSVRGDRQKLTQVVVNLVRNAVHATKSGDEVRVAAYVHAAGDVVLAVEDDGPGVPPELRARLFQPFASAKGEHGLGLGLYMARLIAESHQGRIDLVDRARGARFEVLIPPASPAS
jgi:signal transduction histidine kinase